MTKDKIISESEKILTQKDAISSLENSIPDYVDQARSKFNEDSLYRNKMVESALLSNALTLEFRNIYGIEAPYYDLSTCAVGMDVASDGNLQYDELIQWDKDDPKSKLFTDCPEVLMAAAFDLEKNNFFISGNFDPDSYEDEDTANAKALAMTQNNESDANNNVYYEIPDENGNIVTEKVKVRNLQRFFVDSKADQDGSPFPDPFCPPGLLRWSGDKLYDGICKRFNDTEFAVYDLLDNNSSTSSDYTIAVPLVSYSKDSVSNADTYVSWPEDCWDINANFDTNNHVSWGAKVTGDTDLRYNYNVPDSILDESKRYGKLYYPVSESMLIGITPEKYYRFFVKQGGPDIVDGVDALGPGESRYANFKLCQFVQNSQGFVYLTHAEPAVYQVFCSGIAKVTRLDTDNGDESLQDKAMLSITLMGEPNGPLYLPKSVVEHKYVTKTNGLLKRIFQGKPKEEYGYTYSDDYHPFKIILEPIEGEQPSQDIEEVKKAAIAHLINSYKDIITKYKNFKKLDQDYNKELDLDNSMNTMQAVINAYESGEDFKAALKSRLDYICGESYTVGATNFNDPKNRANIINKYLRLNKNIYSDIFASIRSRINKRGGTLRDLVNIISGMNIAIQAADDKKAALASISNRLAAYKITSGFGSNKIMVQLENWEIAQNLYDNVYRLADVVITGDNGIGYQVNKVIDITLMSSSFEKTQDTEVQPNKIYYANVDNLIYIRLGSYYDEYLPYYYEWKEANDEFELTADTSVQDNKTYYLKLDGGRKYLKVKPLSDADLEYYYEIGNNAGASFEIVLRDKISTDLEDNNPRLVRVVQNK